MSDEENSGRSATNAIQTGTQPQGDIDDQDKVSQLILFHGAGPSTTHNLPPVYMQPHTHVLPTESVFSNQEKITSTPTTGTAKQSELDQRELDLMRKERELLQQELELTKRELRLLQSQQQSGITQPTSFSVPTNFNMTELSAIAPMFDPSSRSNLSSMQWVQKMDCLSMTYSLPDKIVLLLGSTKLCGSAKFWFEAYQEKLGSWAEMKRELVRAFPPTCDESAVHMTLLNKKKLQNESFEHYFYEVLSIASRASLSDQAILKYLINGLGDSALRRSLSLQSFLKPEELLRQLKWYEEMSRLQPEQSQKREVNFCKTVISKDVRKCYNCNETGHISLNCPKPQRKSRCSLCLKIGHTEKECKRETKRNVSLVLRDSCNKTIVINNAFETLAFVDMGSDVSLLRESVARSFNLRIEPCEIILHGFGNGKCTAMGSVKVNVSIDSTCATISMLIVGDTFIQTPALIGRDYVDQDHILVIKANGVLTVSNNFKKKDMSLPKSEMQYEANVLKQELSVQQCDRKTSSTPGNCNEDEVNEIRKTLYSPIEAHELSCGDINEDQKQRLVILLNKFRSAFAKNLHELGCAKSTELCIKLNSTKSVTCRPYRAAYGQRLILQNMVKELLNEGIVKPSTSPYTSPAMLVKKKDGDYRMVVDYRAINAITEKDRHPLPIIEDLLLQLQGCQYFIGLDFASGYYQIPVSEDSQKYTAFVTPDGEYEFCRMPFGLSNGPSTFQRAINNLQRKITKGNLVTYIDDVLIPCKTFDHGMEVLEEFLSVAADEGFTLKLRKTFFFYKRIEFLGYDVSPNGIQPNERKIDAVKSFKRPENIRELRQFLGLTSYFRKFVRNHALIARPLTELTRKDTTFEWTNRQQEAFEKLKNILVTRPLLALYSPHLEHELHTDASSVGLAAILLQKDEDGILHPISYYSRQTTEYEKYYHSYELEALAVVEGVDRFRSFLLGKQFKIVTDCEALKATLSKKEIIPRIARWLLRLSEYDFKIEYRQGKNIQHVDALSRQPNEEPKDAEIANLNVFTVEINIKDWLTAIQMQDPKLENLTRVLREKPLTNEAKQVHKDYKIHNGRLFHKEGDQLKWVVPRGAIPRIIKSCHDELGHFGLERTIAQIRREYWFPRMRNKVKSYISSCIECAYFKKPTGKIEGELHPIPKIPIPIHTVHVDHLGPFPKTASGNTHVLVIVDGFTKYTFVRAVKGPSTAPTIRTLNDFTLHFGTPARIITDRGTAFSSREFKKFCQENDVHHIMTAARTPRANGQVERCNRTLLHAMSTMNVENDKWDKNLRAIQWALNSSKNDTTKRTPHELLFGFQPRDPLGNKILLALHDDESFTTKIDVNQVREEALNEIRKSQEKQKARFNERHKAPRIYQKGDLVLIERPQISTGESRKLDPKYKGPYIVTSILNNDRYVIEDIPGAQRNQRKFKSIYSSDKMKPFCTIPEYQTTDDSNDEYEDDSLLQDGRTDTQLSSQDLCAGNTAHTQQLQGCMERNCSSLKT